jgi:hypothetical protein
MTTAGGLVLPHQVFNGSISSADHKSWVAFAHCLPGPSLRLASSSEITPDAVYSPLWYPAVGFVYQQSQLFEAVSYCVSKTVALTTQPQKSRIHLCLGHVTTAKPTLFLLIQQVTLRSGDFAVDLTAMMP